MSDLDYLRRELAEAERRVERATMADLVVQTPATALRVKHAIEARDLVRRAIAAVEAAG